jgi:hypothetical protein
MNTVKELVSNAASKKPGATLICMTQLKVMRAIPEVILFAVLCAPEGKVVGVDGIVGGAADQPVRRNVLVVVELMNDGLVELPVDISIRTWMHVCWNTHLHG